jgi:hypothetical protein
VEGTLQNDKWLFIVICAVGGINTVYNLFIFLKKQLFILCEVGERTASV